MKTLKKKSLNELKKLLPVVGKSEQVNYNGGTVYCNLSGVYLGKVGNGDDLRFCSEMEFSIYASSNIEGKGISFDSLNNAGQYYFITQNSPFSNAQINEGGSNTDAGLSKDGTLYINENASSWNNYNDALSTLKHEWYHYQNHHYELTGVNNIALAEIETYLDQINSSQFQSTSNEYKKNTAEYLYSYYQQTGQDVSLDDLYRLVGIY